jgi:hypothetical protein
MRKKTARTPGTKGPRHVVHRGLTAKADEPLERSAATECGLDNRSHRTTLEFCWRGLPGDKALATRTHISTLVYGHGSEPRRALFTRLPASRLNQAGNPRSSNSLLEGQPPHSASRGLSLRHRCIAVPC